MVLAPSDDANAVFFLCIGADLGARTESVLHIGFDHVLNKCREMNGDLFFRILFLILFIPGTAIRVYYTRRVRATRKRRSMKERLDDTVQAEGMTGAILLIGGGIYLFVVLPVYLLFSPSLTWLYLPITEWLRWFGFVCGVLSLPFLFWVHFELDRHWDVSLSLRKNHVLITCGPYRLVRHPMYTVHVVYFLSWVLVSANVLFLISYVLTVLLIALRIPKEERMLLDRFGDEYRAYMNRTGRLLPRFQQGTSEEKKHD